jgi:hypothetical protein
MSDTLRTLLQSDLGNGEKVLAVLAATGKPSSISDIKTLAADHGLKINAKWNASTYLRRSKGLAIRTTKGWELTEAGRARTSSWGIGVGSAAAINALNELRAEVASLASEDTRRFLIEAISCVERGYFRAAVVMTWVAAIHEMQSFILNNHLPAFNAEAVRRDSKWRPAKSIDGMSRMKESDFLEVADALGVIGKNVKAELKNCLERRNACGHPNSYLLKELTVAHHVEVLVLNVFSKF